MRLFQIQFTSKWKVKTKFRVAEHPEDTNGPTAGSGPVCSITFSAEEPIWAVVALIGLRLGNLDFQL